MVNSIIPTASASERTWNITASPASSSSKNVIRSILASIISVTPDTDKPFINLGLGDPTVFKLQPPPETTVKAVQDAVGSELANGYLPGVGGKQAIEAVVKYHKKWDGVDYQPEDITLVHGTSHALSMAFSVLCAPGSNVLIPSPGFPLYQTLLESIGIEIRRYNCLPEQDWEIDLQSLESQIDSKTACILVTNPSNPCGTNFTKKHLQEIIDVAERNKVVIVADEVYHHLTWSSYPFTPLATLSSTVPVLTLTGLSKRFLLPGWRFGWICLHDPARLAASVRKGLYAWGNTIMGPNSIIQAALPTILAETGDEWFDKVKSKLEGNAKLLHGAFESIPGLHCTYPTGAMYLLLGLDMSKFPEFQSDIEFCAALVKEQAISCIPGQAFNIPNHVRIVMAAPYEVMQDVCERMTEFCGKHYRA